MRSTNTLSQAIDHVKASRAWSIAGQLALPGAAAQLGLDGAPYAVGPTPSPEGASPHLGPLHGVSPVGEIEHPTEVKARPFVPFRQLPLFERELAEAPQLEMWQRLDVSHDLLFDPSAEHSQDRTAKCHRVRRVPRDADIGLGRHESGAWSVQGLVRCGLWTCPACGPQRARDTSATLAVCFRRHKTSAAPAPDQWMITQSIPHYADEDPRRVQDRLYAASERFWRHRTWRRFAKRWGITSRVRVLDATHGGAHGCHPHFHTALFVDRATIPQWRKALDEDPKMDPSALDDLLPVVSLAACNQRLRERFLDELRGSLTDAWVECVRSTGTIVCDESAFRNHGLMLSPSEKASAYFTRWGFADEVGKSTSKSRSHLRLLDLVDDASAPAAIRDAAGDAYRQFRAASWGRAWVTGLADTAKRLGVSDDDAVAYVEELREKRRTQAELDGEPLPTFKPLALTIRPHLWAGVQHVKWRELFAAVDEADAGGRDAQAFLDELLWHRRLTGRRESLSARAPPHATSPPSRALS